MFLSVFQTIHLRSARFMMDSVRSCVVCGDRLKGVQICVPVDRAVTAPDGGRTLVAFRLFKLLQMEVLSGSVCWPCFKDVELATEYERGMLETISKLNGHSSDCKGRFKSNIKCKRERTRFVRKRNDFSESPSAKKPKDSLEIGVASEDTNTNVELVTDCDFGANQSNEEDNYSDKSDANENSGAENENDGDIKIELSHMVTSGVKSNSEVEKGDSDDKLDSRHNKPDDQEGVLNNDYDDNPWDDPVYVNEEADDDDFDPNAGGDVSVPDDAKKLIHLGKTYEKYAEFERDLQKYCEATFTDLCKVDTRLNTDLETKSEFPYKRVEYVCSQHRKKVVSKGRGIRNIRAPSFCGCTWAVALLLRSKTGLYTVVKCRMAHKNHTPTYESYWSEHSLTEEEQRKYIDDYHLGLKMLPVELRRKIFSETGKTFTVTQIRNWVNWRHPPYT